MGGPYSSDNRAAEQARADEQARQAKIKAGISNIENVFSGGQRGIGVATSYDPNTAYYDSAGNAWNPPVGRNSDKTIADLIKKGRLFTGVEKFGGAFDDKFYEGRAKAYEDYAQPIVGQQFRQASNNLGFALARKGLLNSGAAVERSQSLAGEKAARDIDIGNEGMNQANDLRRDVEAQRSSLVQQALAGSEPALVGSQANAAAALLERPSGFKPIGQLFEDWSRLYLMNQYSQAANQGGQNSNIIFGGSPGQSSRVID